MHFAFLVIILVIINHGVLGSCRTLTDVFVRVRPCPGMPVWSRQDRKNRDCITTSPDCQPQLVQKLLVKCSQSVFLMLQEFLKYHSHTHTSPFEDVPSTRLESKSFRSVLICSSNYKHMCGSFFFFFAGHAFQDKMENLVLSLLSWLRLPSGSVQRHLKTFYQKQIK